MPAFEYQALDARGKNSKGVLEADNARHARALLREQKLTPVSVALASQQEKLLASGSQWFKRNISASELALITRQLATLVEAALPIESALLAVAEQCDKPRLKNMMMTVRSKVVEGYSLAEGLAEFPHVFDHLFRSMVAAGEKSGHLDQVLNRLADYTEQRQHMRSQILQALLYPIILTCFAILVISILLAAVVPKIVGQFEHMGQTLPGTTLFLIAASDFLRAYGIFVLIGFMLLLVLFGVFNGMAHLLFARAFALAPVSVLAPFEYSPLLIGGVIGFLIWAEVPGWTTLAGASLVVAAGLYNVYREQVRRAQERSRMKDNA